MTDSWDDYASGWDENQDVREYRDHALASLLNVAHIENKRILDFGCGTGLLTESLAPSAKQIVALDSSEAMIEVLQQKSLDNVSCLTLLLEQQHLTSVPELAEPFDLIIASSVCGFLPDYPATLALLSVLLKADGLFVQWDWQGEEGKVDSGFTAEQIETAFTSANLKVENIETPFSMGDNKVIMAVGVRN